MDGELSSRLSWYFVYITEAYGWDYISQNDKDDMIRAAEKAGTINNLPSDYKAKIFEAELEWDRKDTPGVPTPWPLMRKVWQ